MMINRSIATIFLLAAAVVAAASRPPQARVDTGTNVGNVDAIKIALPEFQPLASDVKSTALAAVFNKTLMDDLDYAGPFSIISRSLYPLGKFSGPGDIKPEVWTTPAVGAQFIAFGNIRSEGGKMFVEARLWDLKTTQNREAIGQRYNSDDNDEGARLIAHKFADAIVDLIGGVRGIAQTNIAYVCEKNPGVKELCLIDYDGNSAQTLTAYKSIVMSPAFSPDGEKIAFASYRRGGPDIDILSRTDRRPYSFDRVGGTTSMPAWSPDGSKIAFATSRDGSDMEIYVADWNGKNLRRLTISKGVDVSPVWNPKTGLEIAFTSGRTGNAQLYVMSADGTNVRRLFEDTGDVVNPAWSPDGQRIAFAWQKSRTSDFDIYIHELATGRNTQITHDAGNNEKPTWAPDGRHLAFESSRAGGRQIFSMVLDGSRIRQLTNSGRNTGPAWSGFYK
jgi:TolB protein